MNMALDTFNFSYKSSTKNMEDNTQTLKWVSTAVLKLQQIKLLLKYQSDEYNSTVLQINNVP